jgi:paraquat-inducible protein B
MWPGGIVAEPPVEEAEARVRAHRWIAWVWVVPIAAACIVLWLAWRALAGRGPEITISFKDAEGLQPGQTHIQHRNVDVGVVRSLELTPDMSRVIVHARMNKAVAEHLKEDTQFFIVAPRVTPGGISGLSTIVSGSYIEMYPGKNGKARDQFVGLDQPPVMRPDTPGSAFTLQASELGSLTRGSQISYNGATVGQVQDFELDADGKSVKISAFIRSPYDKLVHPETRFWNSGGVDIAVGTRGVRVRATSWQELLTGGIAFTTPEDALSRQPSEPSTVFQLYDDERSARTAPRGESLVYTADFYGNLRGVDAGAAVELQGSLVGEVRASQLKFDERQQTLMTVVTFRIDPEKVQILNLPRDVESSQKDVVEAWLERLVRHGLRAQVSSVSLITGQKVLALDMEKGAGPARIQREGQYAKIPSVPSGDITDILQSVRAVLKNVDRATAGPQLAHAIQSLDQTLTRLDTLTAEVEPDLKSLIASLRETSEATQDAVRSVQSLTGTDPGSGSDLPRLMRELTEAARSVRTLADYLDRHPEALLRGRREEKQ